MTEAERNALEEVREILAPQGVYTVKRILGTGGAASVYLAHHRTFDQPRAIKFLHAGYAEARSIVRRLEEEARIMNALNHPNLARVHEVGFPKVGRSERPYLVMDFFEGGTLADHLETFGSMSPNQAVRAILQILSGLRVAHEAGVVHRDVKPQNILIASDGTLKVSDFGIARVQRLEDGQGGKTRQGAIMGTPGYMSPEQLTGRQELLDYRTDIHAVGFMLYVILTCVPIDIRDDEAFCELLQHKPNLLDGIPGALQNVILRATRERPDDRFPTAAAMADELEVYLASGLPDDPADTPKLGSAPAVKALKALAVDGHHKEMAHGGGTLAPGSTRDQPGNDEDNAAQKVVFVEPSERELSYTIHTDDLNIEVAAIHTEARRRFYLRVVGLLLALVGGAGAWFATRPEPVVEVEQAVNVEPVVEAVPESVVEPAVEAVVESQPVEAQTVPVSEPAKQPAKQPAKVVKDNPTPKKVVVKLPPPEAEVKVEERAQVRLILVNDTVATLTLSGGGGTFTLMGGSREVPQGTYHVSVEMPVRETPQTGTLTVTPGLTVIKCDNRFKKCTGFK